MNQKPFVSYTPMMQQYLEIKEDYADAIVFFRLGDFYEMFFDDAIIASKVLEIALTARDAGEKVPMCGIPFHAASAYIQKLIEKGFKIAIAEQVSEPGKGLVKREVVRLITPGTILEDALLQANSNNYIASILFNEMGYMITYIDISTGESYITEGLSEQQTLDYIESLAIKEIVLKQLFDQGFILKLKELNILITTHDSFSTYEGKLLSNLSSFQKNGAKHILSYLEKTQKQSITHLKQFIIEPYMSFMQLDYKVKKHLEITESLTGSKERTLLSVLDDTKTAMGSRYLKYMMHHPLLEKAMIEERLNAIEAFMQLNDTYDLSQQLMHIYDINRIISRVSFQSANARDLIQLKDSLIKTKNVQEILKNSQVEYLINMADLIDSHDDLSVYLDQAIYEMPPISIKEGSIIKETFSKELMELKHIHSTSQDWLVEFEKKERERTGIKNLKVGFNRVFGYYIEISKGNIGLVTDEFGYERKQTLANNERYISEELKERESIIIHAKEKAIQLEFELFTEVRDDVKRYTESLQQLSHIIAKIDCYFGLSQVALKQKYVRPTFNHERNVTVKNGRHPVVEQYTTFIENDVIMKANEVFLITGPNMSGKSTYMRMYALICYMAQIGCYVPAKSADLPLYDAIFTRIGSSDDLSAGKSTFMVEMVESNVALTKATDKSLILFDEIGRGTATYDGMALAQGMIEYIVQHIKAQTFFSTHYHELTALSNHYPLITNLHVKAKEEKNTMIFLHTVEKGASDKSYGLQVAALAHLPKALIKRSEQILKALENKKEKITLDLFNYEVLEEKNDHVISSNQQSVLDKLLSIDPNQMTPMEALSLIIHLQSLMKRDD